MDKRPRPAYELSPEQIEDVKQGIAEADRGEFASDEEVEAMFARWTR
jgi:predicted transcriptional regulator